MQQCSNFGVDLDRNKNEKFFIFVCKHILLWKMNLIGILMPQIKLLKK